MAQFFPRNICIHAVSRRTTFSLKSLCSMLGSFPNEPEKPFLVLNPYGDGSGRICWTCPKLKRCMGYSLQPSEIHLLKEGGEKRQVWWPNLIYACQCTGDGSCFSSGRERPVTLKDCHFPPWYQPSTSDRFDGRSLSVPLVNVEMDVV